MRRPVANSRQVCASPKIANVRRQGPVLGNRNAAPACANGGRLPGSAPNMRIISQDIDAKLIRK